MAQTAQEQEVQCAMQTGERVTGIVIFLFSEPYSSMLACIYGIVKERAALSQCSVKECLQSTSLTNRPGWTGGIVD
jgi:hypothetical protein